MTRDQIKPGDILPIAKIEPARAPIPKIVYQAHETADRENPRAKDRPAIRFESGGQELAVITMSGHRIGEEMSPHQWAAYIVKAVNEREQDKALIRTLQAQIGAAASLRIDLVEALKLVYSDWDLCGEACGNSMAIAKAALAKAGAI